MPEDVQICPQCGVEMRFRLGEWECPACFMTMPPAPAPVEARPPVRGSRYANVGSSLNSMDDGVSRGKRTDYRPHFGN